EGESGSGLAERRGLLHADLRIGANVAAAQQMAANSQISSRGVIPHGEGMTVSQEQAEKLGLGAVPDLAKYIRPYRNGRDLTQLTRNVLVLDFYGLSEVQVRDRFPSVWQWL